MYRLRKTEKRVAEIAGDELHNIGRNESRAFKNNYAKIAAAFTVLYHIVRNGFLLDSNHFFVFRYFYSCKLTKQSYCAAVRLPVFF